MSQGPSKSESAAFGWQPWLLPLVGFVPPVAALAPRLLLPFGIGAALVLLAASFPQRRRWRLSAPVPTGLAGLALWALASCLWSIPEADPFARWATASAMLAAGGALLLTAPALGAAAVEQVTRGLLAGIALTLGLMAVERLFGSPAVQAIYGAFPIPSEALAKLNRAASLLALLAWWLALRRGGGWGGLLFPALLALLLLFFESATALLGLACGLALALAAQWRAGLAAWAAAATALLALYAMPLLALAMESWDLAQSDWLPNSFRYRVQIWAFAADRILERPWFGWGFEASRVLPSFGETSLMGTERIIPLHPHSAPLQLWLELGLIGTLPVLLLLLSALRAAARLPAAARPAAYGFFGTAVGLSLTGYGLWQGHTLALLLLPLAVFRLQTCFLPAGHSSDAASRRPATATTR